MPEPLLEKQDRLDYVKNKLAERNAAQLPVCGIWFLRSCPHCKGDIFLDREVIGEILEWAATCINCGYRR